MDVKVDFALDISPSQFTISLAHLRVDVPARPAANFLEN